MFLIDYVICGIPDTVVDISVLYGATSISEFKVKLELYGRMHERLVAESKAGAMMKWVPTALMSGGLAVSIVRCFNCGDKGYQSRECPDTGKGPKCFACRAYGHKLFACPVSETKQASMASVSLASLA